MHLSQHTLCTCKTELTLGVKFYLDLHWVTRPLRRTLTNESGVNYVFPRCRVGVACVRARVPFAGWPAGPAGSCMRRTLPVWSSGTAPGRLAPDGRPRRTDRPQPRGRRSVGINERWSAVPRATRDHGTRAEPQLSRPSNPESDQFQISPTASPGISHYTAWRTWLFIAYSDDRWLYYQFSLHHF